MTSSSKHGTYTMYARKKCRCDECRSYQNSRVSRNRAQRLADGNLSHGTRSSYDAGCRCTSCSRARQVAYTSGISKNHNHMTRDIKPYGKCPACDLIHTNGR